MQLSKENCKEKEKLITCPDGGLTPGQTGRLTVGRKITLTLSRPEVDWVDWVQRRPSLFYKLLFLKLKKNRMMNNCNCNSCWIFLFEDTPGRFCVPQRHLVVAWTLSQGQHNRSEREVELSPPSHVVVRSTWSFIPFVECYALCIQSF
jgi:hypothetical protein